jgi:predicted Zn-dependent peptidase
MFERKVGVLLAIGATALATPAYATPHLALPVEEHVLASGVRVVLAPDPALDDATVIVRYAVGSADDPPGKEGLAHLVEHTMYSGSKHVSADAFWRSIERAGGWNANATTTLDRTLYFVTVPPERLEVIFWLESDRMGFLAPQLDEATIGRERAIVAEEVGGGADQLFAAVGDAARRAIFPEWHPYGRSSDAHSLDPISLADVRAFLRTWYVPRNATVIVAGRFDAAAVLALATRYFGDLPGVDPPSRPALPVQWRVPDVRLDMGARSLRDEVSVLWVAPPFGEPDDTALDVAAAVLADPRGRLQKALVGAGLAVRVAAREDSHLRMSMFSVNATVADGVSPEYVLSVVDGAIRAIAADVRQDECDRARDEWIDTELMRLQTSAGRAYRLAIATARSSPFDLGKYDGIRPADVQSAVRRVLTPEHRVVTVVHHDRRYPVRGTFLGRKEQLSKEPAP